MSKWQDYLSTPAQQQLTLALLHFCWQATAIALLAALTLWWHRDSTARVRYGIALLSLCVMAAAPPATVAYLRPVAASSGVSSNSTNSSSSVTSSAREAASITAAMDAGASSQLLLRGETAASRPVSAWPFVLMQPYLLMAWLCGTSVFAVRLLWAGMATWWIRRGSEPLTAADWEWFTRLGRVIEPWGRDRVRVSHRVREAFAVGFWRPIVLLPSAWLLQLPPEVLEAVIAHELGHVRRWDVWVNALQRCLETLLFYHPAVWWLSRRVRIEREMCCDDWAVARTGQRLAYAEALELVARTQRVGGRPRLATAFVGDRTMTLLDRVRNVLELGPLPARISWLSLGLSVLIMPGGFWLASSATTPFGPALAQAAAQTDDDDADRDEQRRQRAERERAERERPREEAERREPEALERRERQGDERRRRAADERRPGEVDERRDREEGERHEREADERRERRRAWWYGQGDRGPRRGGPAEFEGRRGPQGPPRGEGRPQDEALIRVLQELREEVQRLREEVSELREQRQTGRERFVPEGPGRFGRPRWPGGPWGADGPISPEEMRERVEEMQRRFRERMEQEFSRRYGKERQQQERQQQEREFHHEGHEGHEEGERKGEEEEGAAEGKAAGKEEGVREAAERE